MPDVGGGSGSVVSSGGGGRILSCAEPGGGRTGGALYEAKLGNNHLWRTEFGLTKSASTDPAPAWMGLQGDGRSGGEKDWIEFIHRNYWTLLNCGFRGVPTAGTASGVHSVMPDLAANASSIQTGRNASISRA